MSDHLHSHHPANYAPRAADNNETDGIEEINRRIQENEPHMSRSTMATQNMLSVASKLSPGSTSQGRSKAKYATEMVHHTSNDNRTKGSHKNNNRLNSDDVECPSKQPSDCSIVHQNADLQH